MKTLFAAIVFACASTAHACDDGYSISAVLADGSVIKLDDDSLWRVNPADVATASSWTEMSDVLVCDDEKIINVDDDETVYVRRIR
jgi:hypothetical protein